MRINGTVKFYNYTRGFGFISTENGSVSCYGRPKA
jgi:cold shock CspA family protein